MDAKSRFGSTVLKDQIAGIAVKHLNDVNEAAKQTALDIQAQLLKRALEELDGVKAWIEDPSTLLGSWKSKHGELAEIFEVQVRNSHSIIDGLDPTATFDGTARTGAIDFFIDGQPFQSKFYGSELEGLEALVKHLEKYPQYAKETGLMFPSDKLETVQRILSGEPSSDLSKKACDKIIARVKEIEELAGRPFEEVMTPSVNTYAEVQLGVAEETLELHIDDVEDMNAEHVERIEVEHGPSLAGAAQAAAIAGAVSGVITTGMAIYGKAREGKSMFRGDFTADDWKDVGWAGAKGVGAGAVTGGALYAMTNYAGMAAPFAASVVSAAKGLSTLTTEYAAGNIDSGEFFDLGLCVCAESAVVGMATAAGQMLIPIPILGGVIGSISGKMMLQLAHGLDAKHVAALKEEIERFNASLDATYQRVIAEINAEFDKLGRLTEAAFDFELNQGLMLASSVDLAVAYGVPQAKILKSVNEVDAFMLG
jgi:hypothetical protein